MSTEDDLRFLWLPYGVTALLREAGYHTMQQLSQASDEALLAIHGIGPVYLGAIRERCQEAANAPARC